MRKIFPLTLFLTLALSGVYFYQTSIASICDTPIHYRLGTFDNRFSISELEAVTLIKQATSIWEKSTNRDLFIYDENANLPINFIFDDRQERVVEEETLRFKLDSKEQSSTQIATQYKNLNIKYQELHTSYDKRVTNYNVRLKEFNNTVEKYNNEGGVPKEVLAELEVEKSALKVEADTLSTLSKNLAKIVSNLNDLGEQGNRIISQYNDGVKAYNKNFGKTEEFTQGDYQGDKINIYKFSDQTELVKVLLHEFGHSLGIDHVEGSSSIMYYLMENQSDTLALSVEDLRAFNATCGDKEGIIPRLKILLNHFLNK